MFFVKLRTNEPMIISTKLGATEYAPENKRMEPIVVSLTDPFMDIFNKKYRFMHWNMIEDHR